MKVNDVVMALVSGVLRKYLLDRAELPEASLVAMVPVSVHDRSDRPGRNQVGDVLQPADPDRRPAERLQVIAGANVAAKEHSSAIGATLLQDWSQSAWLPAVFDRDAGYARSWLTEARPVHNLVISNVPGPQIPLYSSVRGDGATCWGRSSTVQGSTSIVMSLNGKPNVGLISCPDPFPTCGYGGFVSHRIKELLPPAVERPAPTSPGGALRRYGRHESSIRAGARRLVITSAAAVPGPQQCGGRA